MKIMRGIAAFCCIAFLVFIALMPSARAYAAPRTVQKCPIPDLGTKVPVVLVHGFQGDSSIWGAADKPTSMYGVLANLQKIHPEPFDYHQYSTHWVDDPNIGPALAQRIDYLAQASLCTHGHGKVIVIAHSMGGLATRYAAAQVVNGHKISDELGLVITIGTPNFGSLVADVGTTLAEAGCFDPTLIININGHPLASHDTCGPWSAMIAMQTNMQAGVSILPMLPQSVPLMGIAGDVHSYFQAFESRIEVSDSDTIVLTNSALVGHSQTAQGAGTAVFRCYAWNPTFLYSDGDCAHGNLPSNPAVQAQVATSINLYLASLQQQTVHFDGLNLQVPNTWRVQALTNDLLEVVDPRNCDLQISTSYWVTPPCTGFRIWGPQSDAIQGAKTEIDQPYRPDSPLYYPDACPGHAHDPLILNKGGGRNTRLNLSGVRPIGNRQAQYHEWIEPCVSNRQGPTDDGNPVYYYTNRIWYIPGQFVIDTYGLPELDAILAQATWS